MKKLFILTLLTFLAPLALLAQSNYKPGDVVTLKGDTIKGFVDYQEWNTNPDSIRFKKTLDGERNLYGVNEIKYFDIEGVEQYQKFTVNISNGEIDPNKIDYERDTTFRTATVFLRVMQRGSKVALFSYTDKLKVRYYIAEAPDFTPSELIYRTYLNRQYEDPANVGIKPSKTTTEYIYRKQLSGAAVRLDMLTDKMILYIRALQYNGDDMLKIVSKLNHIDKAAYESKRNLKRPYQFIVGAGLNFSGYEPSGFHQYNLDGTYYNSTQPWVSAGVTLFPAPNTRQLMFRFEVVLSDGTYKAFGSYKIFETSVVPQVLYNLYNGEDFKVFAGIGFSFDNYSYSDQQYTTLKSSSSFHFKGGVQVGQNIAIQFQYINSNTSAHSTQLGINYLFE